MWDSLQQQMWSPPPPPLNPLAFPSTILLGDLDPLPDWLGHRPPYPVHRRFPGPLLGLDPGQSSLGLPGFPLRLPKKYPLPNPPFSPPQLEVLWNELGGHTMQSPIWAIQYYECIKVLSWGYGDNYRCFLKVKVWLYVLVSHHPLFLLFCLSLPTATATLFSLTLGAQLM